MAKKKKKTVQEQLCLRLQPGFSRARQSAAAKEELARGIPNARRIIYDEAAMHGRICFMVGFRGSCAQRFLEGTIKTT